MTDKHTPGPWRIQATIYSRQPQIVNEHGAFVADTDAHNARLIAASPEMWDLIVAGVDNLDFTTGDEELTAEEVAWRRKAVALIAKARGTQ